MSTRVTPSRFALLLLSTGLALSGASSRAEASPFGKASKPAVSANSSKSSLKPRNASRLSQQKQKHRSGVHSLRTTSLPKGTAHSASQVVGRIRPGSKVYLPVGHSIASSVVEELIKRADTIPSQNPIQIVGLSNVASRRLFAGKGIVASSLFVGANNREAIARGRGDVVPVHLSRVAALLRDKTLKVDVAVIQVSPPDSKGMVSLGTTAGATLAAMKAAKTVIAEVNPNVPRTFGATRFHKSQIDYLVPGTAPIRTIPRLPTRQTDRDIAKHVMGLIPKSPTLQFGIGTTTDAIASLLASSGRKDLRVHSEMISDGTMDLVKSGAVKGKVVYSFALGSQELVSWMNNNTKLRSKSADVSNSVLTLAKIPRLVSINSAIRVDLSGQANAESLRGKQYSGIGGQQDFFRGAMLSSKGKAILTLPSTALVTKPNGKQVRKSRITLALGKGDRVTTGMQDVQYIVTEYGVAHLEGKSLKQRAEALIAIAHPDFRDKLTKKFYAQFKTKPEKKGKKRKNS